MGDKETEKPGNTEPNSGELVQKDFLDKLFPPPPPKPPQIDQKNVEENIKDRGEQHSP